MTIAIDDALHQGLVSHRVEELLKAEGHHITHPLSDEHYDLLLHNKALNLPRTNGIADWKLIHKALREQGYLPTTKYLCQVYWQSVDYGSPFNEIVYLTLAEIEAIEENDDYSSLGIDPKQATYVEIEPQYDNE